MEILKYLIEKLENNNYIDDKLIHDCFPYVLESGNLELIKYLENKGWNIYNLSSACKSGNLEFIKYLVEKGWVIILMVFQWRALVGVEI